MQHTSIKLDVPCELINLTPLNPLISKCQIKVCYVGQEPNRNGSVITKEVATEMANSLPGSPIVGFYNTATEDFEEHNRRIELSGGVVKFEDMTRPYGFVDLNATAWFQDYLDDGVVHTYLVTEGYIWTGQYPETQRILEKGNNQSMELDEESLDGSWTIDYKTGVEFFIINEAIISKLCILGEDFEPCFEGASISKFSLDDEFNQKIYSLMKKVQELKGGNPEVPEEELKNEEILEEEVSEGSEEVLEEVSEGSEEVLEEEVPEESEEVSTEPVCEFSLEDYENLKNQYSDLESQFSVLQQSYNELETECIALRNFKLEKDREAKQSMIDSFCMLSDAEKAEVQENIDTYSLEDIESKLAVICVRNKLDLSEHAEERAEPETAFSLDGLKDSNDDVPALISALRKTKNSKNEQ